MQNSFVKAKRIKDLENGKGIQYILDKAYEILGNPILIHDMEYKAIAYNQNVAIDDPIWNEYVTTGTVGYHWLEFFKNECFIEEAANARKITLLTSNKLDYNRIFGKIFNKGNIQIGCAVIVASNKPFESDDPILFEDVCNVLSVEFGMDDFYNNYGQTYFEKLVDALITNVHDIALYAAHVESIYIHLKANLYLAVVDIEKCDSTYTQLAYYRDLLKKTQPEYTYAIHTNYVLIIISIDDSALHIDKNLNELNRLFCSENIYVGISSSFENLFDLGKYYKEALNALDNAQKDTHQHIFLHE